MKQVLLGLSLVTAMAVPVQAQVHVQIGFQLPGPPPFVVIPGMPVYYAPQAPANVFFYAHQYWGFAESGWYVGPSLEWSVDGRPTNVRSGANSPRSRPLLSGASAAMESVARGSASAVGVSLRTGLARRGPRTELA